MPTLIEDFKVSSDWIVKAFQEDKQTLNYTIHSFIEIDRFFNKHVKDGKPVRNGRLSQNLDQIVFSIGAYVGETILRNTPGTIWEIGDNDPEGEINASIKLPDGTIFWPMQRVMKRFQNGSEDSIYVYGHDLTKDYTKEEFDEIYWQLAEEQKSKKPWWKF